MQVAHASSTECQVFYNTHADAGDATVRAPSRDSAGDDGVVTGGPAPSKFCNMLPRECDPKASLQASKCLPRRQTRSPSSAKQVGNCLDHLRCELQVIRSEHVDTCG